MFQRDRTVQLHSLESRESGGLLGSSWVDDNIEAVVSIGTPFLGASKVVSALMSGEMRDTAQLGPLQPFLVDSFVSKSQRRNLFRSWGSLQAMLPKGGDVVWGNHDCAPDDKSCENGHSRGRLVTFVKNGTGLTAEKVIRSLQNEDTWSKANDWCAHGPFDSTSAVLEPSNPQSWCNPLLSPLPRAPHLTYYCMYGFGKLTERSYYYDDVSNNTESFPVIDSSMSDDSIPLWNGVVLGDGDGTVPLLSLGYMCVEGWRRGEVGSGSKLNPGGSQVVTKEYRHSPSSLNPRGGPETADHVDILGNLELLRDVLLIATGHGEEVSQRVVSDIERISKRVGLY